MTSLATPRQHRRSVAGGAGDLQGALAGLGRQRLEQFSEIAWAHQHAPRGDFHLHVGVAQRPALRGAKRSRGSVRMACRMAVSVTSLGPDLRFHHQLAGAREIHGLSLRRPG